MSCLADSYLLCIWVCTRFSCTIVWSSSLHITAGDSGAYGFPYICPQFDSFLPLFNILWIYHISYSGRPCRTRGDFRWLHICSDVMFQWSDKLLSILQLMGLTTHCIYEQLPHWTSHQSDSGLDSFFMLCSKLDSLIKDMELSGYRLQKLILCFDGSCLWSKWVTALWLYLLYTRPLMEVYKCLNSLPSLRFD